MVRGRVACAAVAMIVAMAVSFSVVPASATVADVTDTYTVTGSYFNFIDPTITGTLTIDLTIDKVTSANINTGSSSSGGFGTFTLITGQGGFGPGGRDYIVDLNNGAGITLALVLDTRSTLFGGSPTTIDPRSDFIFNSIFGPIPCFTCIDFQGSIAVSSSGAGLGGVAGGVPEASTWAMMILGFFGLGCFAHCRKQSRLA
jgi:hypothetical protein